MKSAIPGFFFDKRDYRLLNIVNEVLCKCESFSHLNNLLYPYLHPHGIKELAESKGLRMAYAVIRLMESLETDKAGDRLNALRSLKDEVLNSADSHLRRNTARVLLQIMKELVRTRDNETKQLELAHDFRSAVSGKPRIIRRLLREYHLLEMPEEWNQIAFDGHVHDSCTKGRKSPSHLIMDAWIKGIRYLTVIYYNYADLEPVVELMSAAEIMDINIRIGVEFPARFHDRYVRLIWVPHGFSDAQDFVTFLSEQHITDFMREGRRISEYQQGYVLAVLREFNEKHRQVLNETYGLDLAPLEPSDFLSSVKIGQPSILHLAKFIHSRILPLLSARLTDLRKSYSEAPPEERPKIAVLAEQLNTLDSEAIAERFLYPQCNPDIPDPNLPQDGPGVPEFLELSPFALIDRLSRLNSGFRITLNLTDLTVEDVLELLYDCGGHIDYLEIFNLKDYINDRTPQAREINELQRCINEGSAYRLNRMIRGIIRRMADSSDADAPERVEKFREILQNASALKGYYKNVPLRSSIGSDSTGFSRRFHGMGFAVRETLPSRTQRELRRHKSDRMVIPVSVVATLRTVFIPKSGFMEETLNRLAVFFGGSPIFSGKRKEWELQNPSTRIVSSGNIVSLGGISERKGNGLDLEPPKPKSGWNPAYSWRYLNGGVKDAIKILIGFIPSALTFWYTQDWWFLVYLGTPIWFAITGLRNVLQSVFGGGGIRRSPLLKWNSYVSWDRIADSLLYTGLSVPLLEYFLKTLILDQGMHVTTSTDPIMLYSVMSIVNGLYIAGHNVLRGLPKGAIIGNLFRSILNIPISIGFNSGLGLILGTFGVTAVNDILQQWASIISKTSSDVVAGIIEGLADGYNYVRIRFQDYAEKFSQLFATHEQLEILFPEADPVSLLDSPDVFVRQVSRKKIDLEKIMIVNALDLLYFWMYQPRARNICRSLLRKMPLDELRVIVNSQAVLRREREITQLFANGLVGKSFSRPLAFYLGYCGDYLDALENLATRRGTGRDFIMKPATKLKEGHSLPHELLSAARK